VGEINSWEGGDFLFLFLFFNKFKNKNKNRGGENCRNGCAFMLALCKCFPPPEAKYEKRLSSL